MIMTVSQATTRQADGSRTTPTVEETVTVLLAEQKAEVERLASLRAELQTIESRVSAYDKLIEGYAELHPEIMDHLLRAESTAGSAEDESDPPSPTHHELFSDEAKSPAREGSAPYEPREGSNGWYALKMLQRRSPEEVRIAEAPDYMRSIGWKTKSTEPVRLLRSVFADLAKQREDVVRRASGSVGQETVYYRFDDPDDDASERDGETATQ